MRARILGQAGIGLLMLACLVRPAAADTPARPALEQLVPRLSSSVMQIVVPGERSFQYGSAVQIDGDLAVTNCHVVGGARQVQLVGDGTARVLLADRRHDLCLLQVRAGRRTVAVLTDEAAPAVGSAVHAIGYSRGRPGWHPGCVLARYEMDGGWLIRTSASFSTGASGGGLFDEQGRLIGVLTFYRAEPHASAYLAVPVHWLRRLVQDWQNAGGSVDDRAARPFWDVTEPGNGNPWFLDALILELQGRWAELEGSADRRLIDEPGDEAASTFRALAQARQGEGPEPTACPPKPAPR